MEAIAKTKALSYNYDRTVFIGVRKDNVKKVTHFSK